jgi:hypothetical protein
MINSVTEEQVMLAEKYLSILEAIAAIKVDRISQEDLDKAHEYIKTLEWI